MTSAINPNNIDATYPVAGQPNNTQGFRDNFTATKTNFQSAADEITDLQNKVILKAALTGSTLDNNMNDALLLAAKIQDFSATAVNVATTSGSVLIDYAAGHYQSIATTGNISLSFINWPPTTSVGLIRLQIIVSTAGTQMTFPVATTLGTTGIQGLSGNTVTFAAVGTYEFAFLTRNGGLTITIFDLNRPLSYYTNPVTIAANTVSTSNTTGALLVAGGAGIVGNVNAGNLRTTGSILSSSASGGIGFTTGAGNTAVQATNKTTGVTLNYPTGQITYAAGNVSSGANVSFTMTNSAVGNTDVMIINHVSGGTIGAYDWYPQCNAGNAVITMVNRTGGTLNEQPVIRFVVVKGATS